MKQVFKQAMKQARKQGSTLLFLLAVTNVQAQNQQQVTEQMQRFKVSVQLPSFGRKCANPYVALWTSDDKGQHHPLVLLKEKTKWLRDLKVFWRKIARENRQLVDAVTGATTSNKNLEFEIKTMPGSQTITIEVVREHGKRETLTLAIAPHCISGKVEVIKVCLSIDRDI